MKRPFTILLSLLFMSFFSVQQASAGHITGSTITYKCTSTPGIFEITLVVYRNRDAANVPSCTGGCGFSCTQPVEISGADAGCSSTVSLQSVRDANINPYCPQGKNICSNMGCVTPGTYTPGIERYEFSEYINLGPISCIPTTCCNIRLSWQKCCRGTQLQTGSGQQ